jgi:hypothetical protein
LLCTLEIHVVKLNAEVVMNDKEETRRIVSFCNIIILNV